MRTLLVLSEEISRKLSEKVVTQQVIYSPEPSQDSKAAAKEQPKRKIKLLSIPPRSPDINPLKICSTLLIQNSSDAIEQNITHEIYEQSSARVHNTLENYPIPEIDKIIDTMPKRMHRIINCNGGRLRYLKETPLHGFW